MHIHIIGAGAMGCLYGSLLSRAGCEVTLIDTWREHVDAMNRDGLHMQGLSGEFCSRVPAVVPPGPSASADVALILVNTYATEAAAQTAKHVLKPSGYALTLQNGVGNVEILQAALGRERVMAGLSYHSALVIAPGRGRHTHAGVTWIGETDGSRSGRLEEMSALLDRAGLKPQIVDDVMAFIWSKLIHNSAINGICAIMGIRVGEIPRTPGADELQTKIIDEALTVLRAKGVKLADPDPIHAIKAFCQVKFNKPSMLLHMEAGKPTEIDALNGAIAREAKALGIAAPYNEALTWMVKGLQAQRHRIAHEPPIDYEKLEAEAKAKHAT
jgi:2-dehydropantoate 2-reductase